MFAVYGYSGGPGASGVDTILSLGPSISKLSGGYYDIVSWDPRGVGKTMYDTRFLITSSLFSLNVMVTDLERSIASIPWKSTLPFGTALW